MYNLNINKSSIVPTNLIVGRVLDKPFDTIQFKIYDGLDVMDLTGCTLEFRGTTPDNKKVTSNVVKILDAKSGEIEFTFPPNFYSAKGHFQNAYFVIKKGNNSESTNDLLITVLNAVDFNLDDAPIIIDQLDDLIQAVIDDLNNQLSKVKGDIKQTQDNITTLKNDVDAYKGQFNTEIARMQKQLDDLAKAINQTDIQRPQITKPDGSQFEINDKNKTMLDFAKQLGAGTKKVYIHNAVGIPEQYLHGLMNISTNFSVITFEGSAVISGNPYSFALLSGVEKGWKRLDGQVPKITADNGGIVKNFNDSSTEAIWQLNTLLNGMHYVMLQSTKGQPENWIYGVFTKNAGTSGNFVGCATGSGNPYSYSYNNGVTSGWRRLDGQVPKITHDDGNQFSTLDDKNKSSVELLSSLPNGVQSVYLRTATDLPDGQRAIGVKQSINTNIDGQFTGVAVGGGNTYSITYSSGSSRDGWKRLDGQVPKITQDDGSFREVLSDTTIDLYDYLSKLGRGTFSIYSHNSKNQPETFIAGIVTQTTTSEGKLEGMFIGNGLATGNAYTYSYASSGVKGWRRLDNQTVPNVSTTQNGLMLATDKVKLDKLTIPLSKGELLWSGESYPNGATTLNPSKKLSECENGWIITMQNFSNYTLNNWDFSYHYIEKTSALKNSGYNTKLLSFNTNGASMVYKQVYITDDSIKGHDDNEKVANNKLQVISAIHSW